MRVWKRSQFSRFKVEFFSNGLTLIDQWVKSLLIHYLQLLLVVARKKDLLRSRWFPHVLFFPSIIEYNIQILDWNTWEFDINLVAGVLGLESWGWSLWAGVLGLESWGWSPGAGVLGLESWGWSPGDGVLGLESRGWSPGAGVLGLESWAGVLGMEVSWGGGSERFCQNDFHVRYSNYWCFNKLVTDPQTDRWMDGWTDMVVFLNRIKFRNQRLCKIRNVHNRIKIKLKNVNFEWFWLLYRRPLTSMNTLGLNIV